MLQRRVGKLRPVFNQTVLINQTAFDSTYFRLDDVPDELTAGKNMFKIYGNNQLLLPNTEILIQITDINGNPVYHHVNNFVDATGRLVIGVWVYPETPPGLGKIEILGRASHRPDGRPVPNNWSQFYNVKWSREVVIRPTAVNKTPIIFQTIPGLKIFEYEREYLTQTYLTGTSIAAQSVGELTYTYSGFGDAYITITGGNFSASMAGGLLTIPDPNFSLPAGYNLQPGATTEYLSYISQVVNNTTIKVDPYVLPIYSTITEANLDGDAGRAASPGVSTVNSAYPVTSFGPVTNHTTSFQQEATYATGSQNSQSFASVTLKNIDPIVGKVHSIKTYMKSHGYADYQVVSNEILQERDLLINVNSSLAYDPMGDFKSQEIINNFWITSSVNQPSYTPYCKHSDSQMISSMLITGSTGLAGSTNYPSAPLATDPFIKVVTRTGVDIYKDNEYQVKFRVVAESDTPTQVSSSLIDIYISGSNIGSTDERNLGHKLITLETENTAPGLVTNVTQYNGISDLVMSSAPVNAPSIFGLAPAIPGLNSSTSVPAGFTSNTAQAVNPNITSGIDERLLELVYTPQLDTTAHIVFAVTRGKWHFSNVELEGANDYGFTPNHTFLEFPIQTPQADDVLDFKFEFYNTAGEIANITLTTQSLDFVGSNLFIDGNSNILTGTVIIGDGIIMQGVMD